MSGSAESHAAGGKAAQLNNSSENSADDLEEEQDDGVAETNIDRPYDPTLIRVDPKMFSLRNILDMIDEGDLDLSPDFQRLRVWKAWQKSRLIESILLRIPLPAFYFSSDSTGLLQVVDGVQRLSTIYAFVRGGVDRGEAFDLNELEYLQDVVGGKSFKDLEGTFWAKRLNSTQIVANVIDSQTPPRVKFDIFKRINTGGTPLTSQEIRHCMASSRLRNFLKHHAECEEFERATGGRLTGHIRMADRELVLRGFAFMLNPSLENVWRAGSMENLLNSAAEQIDVGMGEGELSDLSDRFKTAMRLAREIFGKRAFRKWLRTSEQNFPLNRALFDVWTSVLASAAGEEFLYQRDSVIQKFRGLCSDDTYFIQAISAATFDPKKIVYRFNAISNLLES